MRTILRMSFWIMVQCNFRRTLSPAIALLCPAVLAEPFDYHSVRGREASGVKAGIIEGEHLSASGRARTQHMNHYGDGWSGNAHLLWDGEVGDAMKAVFRIEVPGPYRVFMQLTQARDYGTFDVDLNGNRLAKNIDTFAPKVRSAKLVDLGEIELKKGEQRLTFELTGANQKANNFKDGYLLGLDYLKLEPINPTPIALNQTRDEQAVYPAISFEETHALVAEYCIGCHGSEKEKGKVNLEKMLTKDDFMSDMALTSKVADALAFREMPPEDEKQLPREKHAQLNAWFQSVIDEHIAQSSELAPVVMRRMNRYEYNNAVRELLELKGDLYPLPEKVVRAAVPYFDPASGHFPSAVTVSNRALGKNQIEQHILTGVVPFAIDLQAEHGFNNRGEELSISPILLESFLTLGRSIVNSSEFDAYSNLTPTLFAPPIPDVSAEDSVAIAQSRLRPLLERAFRGRVDLDVVARYRKFFERELARSGSFTESMKSTVAGVLASPRFVFISEDESASDSDAPLNAYELATRLSFFLWSTIPDAPLMESARSGKLRQPMAFEKEVRRMLEDPRSRALSENFARQWMRLDQLITAVPDFERFERYYSRIGCEQWKFGLQTMIEPLLLFESIMVEDRSIMLLIDSNYSYRSDEVASWYADEIPFGNKENRGRFNTNVQTFKRRTLTTRREGGIITTGATMTMTSSPLRTSPINRGAWVATVILNKPPPPPPDVVPEIEADDAEIEAKGITLRQRLIQHQVNQSCVSCHQKIDPLGFALENFDPIGRWRDSYRSGLAIDASGTLFGESKFKDIVGLKDVLLANPEWFMRGFSEHLLSYALGRELELSDKPAVDKIVRRVLADHGQFSTVVLEVAKSYPFQSKSRPSSMEAPAKTPLQSQQ